MDWIRFLESTGTPHVVGPTENVRRGHVGIPCPRCVNDRKFFFSIEIDTGRVRGCWWDPSHWMAPTVLVAHLAHVTMEEAHKILHDGEVQGEVDTKDLLKRLTGTKKLKPWQPKRLEWPEEARPFSASPGRMEYPFHEYMRRRGFANPHSVGVCYGLRWCATGPWGPRILFPLDYKGKMVGWSGRAIVPMAKAKYRTHPEGETVRHLLWGIETKMAGELLVLCEGPFDALKVDYYAGRRPVSAIALLGLNYGPRKLTAIVEVAQRFRQTVILLDRNTESQGLRLQADLSMIQARVGTLPEGVKDPGDLTHEQVGVLLDGLL